MTKEIFCSAPIGSISIKVGSVYQDTSDCVYYKVTLSIEDYQHDIGRRYSQFREFDKTLRYHFPDISFPLFPSKYAIFNKIEQRKKSFNAYMSGLIQLLGIIRIDQKATFMRLLAEFLELDGASETLDERPRISASSRSDLSDMVQKIAIPKQYQGWVNVKLDDMWRLFYVSIKGDYLLLHENCDTENFMYSIGLFLGKIQQGSDDAIELHHENQSSPIYFKTQNPQDFKKALLTACSSSTDSPLSKFKKNCAGRVSITLHSAHYIKISKPPASTVKPLVYISVDLDCFSFKTRTSPQNEELHWGQTFIM